jgi:hypothetical protein
MTEGNAEYGTTQVNEIILKMTHLFSYFNMILHESNFLIFLLLFFSTLNIIASINSDLKTLLLVVSVGIEIHQKITFFFNLLYKINIRELPFLDW